MSATRKLVPLALFALACAVPAVPAQAAEPKTCTFTTTDDDDPDTVIAVDTDADNFCEWPTGSESLHGTLTFPAGTLLEFRANTTIIADRIVVEQGAVLAGISSRLNDLTLRARQGFQGSGEINIRAADDVTVSTDNGDVNLFGPTRLVAGDKALVQARRGSVRIAPPDIDSIDVGAFTVLGCTNVIVKASGFDGKIIVNRSRIGGRRVTLDTHASLSQVQNKALTVLNSVITTKPAETGCGGGDNIFLRSNGVIYVGASKLRAASNITFRTDLIEDGDLCLADGTELDANGGLGRIDARAVRGHVFFKSPGEEPDLIGRYLGDPIELGECPIPQ